MRPDVHAAALRSAAKLVLGMASIASITTACSSEATDDTGSSTDAVMTKNDRTNDTDKTDPSISGGHVPGGDVTTTECKATLESAFPSPSFKDYGVTTPQPAKVLDCCDQELTKHGAMTAYRWECCFAYDENVTVDPGKDGQVDPWEVPTLGKNHGLACTPWGPPVPPEMNRAQKRSRKLSPARREMNRFIARQLEAQLAQVA